MFALGAGMLREMTKKDEFFVLVCGPESSGKTTFAEQFRAQCDPKFSMPKRTTPTMGLNLVKFDIDGFVLNFWDVGGNEELISMWDRYVEDCHAIIFVVDSCTESKQFEACTRALNKLVNFKHVHEVPLMIVLNKCDLLDGQSTCSGELERLREACQGICEPGHRADMAVFSISALKATNIQRCRKWISHQLLTFGTRSAQASTADSA